MDITIEGSGGAASRVLSGPLSSLGNFAEASRSVIVTDPEIRRLLGPALPPWPVAEVPRGEAAKSLASLEELYGRFLDLGLGRDATVVAVGGGTVSDLAGFAASTWLRGVDFGFAPTTLLAMVDASVGGKNGVDFRGLKNQVGTFRQPRFVLMDVGLLSTLPELEFASGLAEAVKCALLSGGEYLEFIESSRPRSASSLSRGDLERLVEGSVRVKAGIVGLDERESGERRKLNLGHTVGHAVESATGLPHGHAVAAGLGTACRLSARLGRMKAPDADRVVALLAACGLPASIGEAVLLASRLGTEPAGGGGPVAGDGPAFRERVAASLAADKKRLGSDILLVLPIAPGDARVEAYPLRELADFVMEAP